jgi:hypothetical protein
MNKKQKIKKLVKEMLNQSHKEMIKKIDTALNSGALDIESWEEDNAPMVLPKIIVAAILQRESWQYEGTGTTHEKKIKKEIKNLHYFL